MDSAPQVIVPLAEAGEREDTTVGGKARTLGVLIRAGYRVPSGFCIEVGAYEDFVRTNDLVAKIQMELGRKPLATMRWEEIWDAALRIRSGFLSAPVPQRISEPILRAYRRLAPDLMAVRSSAPGEDSGERSYAGLHESLVGVKNEQGLLDAVRIVWASLWSDAALLYRRELGLDVHRSRMAVVVQEFIAGDPSGVAFGIDPRQPGIDREIVEAVPGICEGLVSGAVDPDRWILKRSTGELIQWTPGDRGTGKAAPLLSNEDLSHLHTILQSVEGILEAPPDLEWTGRSDDLTLLQARPVTTASRPNDEREWYLSLRPGDTRLRDLCKRVTEDLIPRLEAEAAGFAAEAIETLSDLELAQAIETRRDSNERWKTVYKEEFIPFAHGVRRLGLYYNDALHPRDPYEFVGLLEHEPMIASRRNEALVRLAIKVRQDEILRDALSAWVGEGKVRTRDEWQRRSGRISESKHSAEFIQEFERFLDDYLDVAYKGETLNDRPDLSLAVILEIARGERLASKAVSNRSAILERRLIEAVGDDCREEANEMLRIGRLSWKLRDDDNILMGRLQSQLHRAIRIAGERIRRDGRLEDSRRIRIDHATRIVEALRDPGGGPIRLPQPAVASGGSTLSGLADQPITLSVVPEGESPRQMIGQPAAPGWATGTVRVVHDAADFRRFKKDEVMVCDAIQPTMTHLVPLASAIVERRGGMLIHGAIIARELGVPCVNGIADATRRLKDGDLVTVDGHLGIVTVGRPDFDLERKTGS